MKKLLLIALPFLFLSCSVWLGDKGLLNGYEVINVSKSETDNNERKVEIEVEVPWDFNIMITTTNTDYRVGDRVYLVRNPNARD